MLAVVEAHGFAMHGGHSLELKGVVGTVESQGDGMGTVAESGHDPDAVKAIEIEVDHVNPEQALHGLRDQAPAGERRSAAPVARLETSDSEWQRGECRPRRGAGQAAVATISTAGTERWLA